MDYAALSALLEQLDSRHEAEERRREESPDRATHPYDPTEPQLTNPSLCTSTTTTGTGSTTSQTAGPDGQPCLPSMETKVDPQLG
ncbi:UNVERIFIED_CONTAM: hypothetical protein FKN15_004279 [Acipenser sinensis]